MSVHDAVEQFTINMLAQVDLRKEAYNLLRFQKNFAGPEWNNIVFPTPFIEYLRKNVLIESFEEGERLSAYLHDEVQNSDRKLKKIIADLGINSYMKMMLLDHFVHADLHPGNILVR